MFQRALDQIESLQSTEPDDDRPVLTSGEALAAQKAVGDVRALPVDDSERDVAEAG